MIQPFYFAADIICSQCSVYKIIIARSVVMNSPHTEMGVFSTEINESNLILTSTALFIFLTASTWAGIIRIYFNLFSLNRFLRTGTVILVCSGNFSYLLTLDLLLYMYMLQHTKSIFLNGCDHFVEHIKCTHFIFNNRISLSISSKSDTLTKDFHIINVIHPLAINAFQKYNSL